MERPRASQSAVDENWKKAINPDLNEATKVPHPRDVKEIKVIWSNLPYNL